MKNIRQILLDKTSMVRIKVATDSGDSSKLAVAKARFENLDYSEVTFKSVEPNELNNTYIGVIELTGRDGFEFTQKWSPGAAVPVLKTSAYTTVPNWEYLSTVIVPGLYYVTDINEMILVFKEGATVERIMELLGYEFEPDELTVIDKYLQLDSSVVKGSIPVHQLFPNPDGTLSDGTSVALVFDEPVTDETLVANPDAPAQSLVISRVGQPPNVDGNESKVRVEFTGTYRNGEVVTGELNGEGKFTIPLDLAFKVGETLEVLVSIGVDADKKSELYTIDYTNENWVIGSYTVPANIKRVDQPFEIAGTVTGDFTTQPWGLDELTPKVVIEEVGQPVVEYPFDVDGSFHIIHTPVTDGEMTVRFVCGLPQDVNMFTEAFTILAALQVSDMVMGPLSVDSTDVNSSESVNLTSTLKSTDGLVHPDASVDVLLDDVVKATIKPDSEGNLTHAEVMTNTTLDPVQFVVKLRDANGESNAITITVQAAPQIPTSFVVVTADGTLGLTSNLEFKILDDQGREIKTASGTYVRNAEAPAAFAFDTDAQLYVIALDSPADDGNETVESVELTCQDLTQAVNFTWKVVKRVTAIVVDAGTPTTGETDATVTLIGVINDQYGNPMPNLEFNLVEDNGPANQYNTDATGKFSVDVTSAVEGVIAYDFSVESVTAQHEVTWSNPA